MTKRQQLENKLAAAFTAWCEAAGVQQATSYPPRPEDSAPGKGYHLRFDTRGFLDGGYEIATYVGEHGGISITHYLGRKTIPAAIRKLNAMTAEAKAKATAAGEPQAA